MIADSKWIDSAKDEIYNDNYYRLRMAMQMQGLLPLHGNNINFAYFDGHAGSKSYNELISISGDTTHTFWAGEWK